MADREIAIDKLNDDNFEFWKFNVSLLFEKKDIKNVVSGNDVKPEETDAAACKAWCKRDSEARYYIASTIERRFTKHILHCKTAKEMWEKICNIFEKKTAAQVTMLQRKLHNLKLGANEKVSDYVAEARNLSAQLEIAGDRGVSDDMLQTIIIEGLPSVKYSGFLFGWNSKPIADKTLINLETELITAEELLSTQDEEIIAMTASTTASKSKTQKKSAEKDKTRFEGQCFYCKKIGHRKSECRKLNYVKAKGEAKKPSTPGKKTTLKDKEEETEDAVLVAQTNIAEGDGQVWLADSGASYHMAHDISIFENIKKAEISHIKLGDTSQVPVIGKGDVRIEALVNGKWKPCRLTNVLCVPDLRTNLFSFSHCTDHGYRIESGKSNMKVIKNDKVYAIAKRIKSLYVMEFRKPIIAEANATEQEVNKLQLWHERLGHAGLTTMKKLVEDNPTIDLNKQDLQNFKCEACIFGKMKRKSFKPRGEKQYEPGEMVHSDVCGPFQTESYNGMRYYVVFKDDASEYRCVYTIKSKANVLEKFVQYANLLRNRFNRDLKILKTDNGREYVNEPFMKFIRARGIEHQTTAPYNPEQNGKSERDIQTINAMIRSMIFGRNLPKYLWSEAVNMATYILNRSPTSKNNKSPFERWSNKKPDLSSIRVFGCVAYAHVPEQQRRKLDFKAQKLIFTGYQGNSDNCRLFDPKTRKIKVAASVRFDEEMPNQIFSEKVGDDKEARAFIRLEDNSEDEVNSEEGTMIEWFSASSDTDEEENTEEEPMSNPSQDKRVLRDRTKIKKPEKLSYPQVNIAEAEPTTFEGALQSSEAKQWKEAIDQELSAHMKNKTWFKSLKPENKRAITCKWIFKRKVTPGEPDRYKARLVARGFTQQRGIDYVDTYAPVVRYESIRMLLALAAEEKLNMLQFDVKTAFLYGTLEEDIWIQLPEGPWSEEERVVKLRKSLYGLKQSPHCWNEKFNQVLAQHHLQRSEGDDCIYVGKIGTETLYLALYVDDGLLLCKSLKLLEHFLQQISKEFEIKICTPSYFVGIEIERDQNQRITKIHQATYVKKLLGKFKMEDAKGISIPVDPHVKLSKQMSPTNDAERRAMINVPFSELIGSLQFLANVTRFDIAFGVNLLSRYLQDPGPEHWRAAKRVLRYLKETCNEGISYNNEMPERKCICYSDSDFAGDEDERRSTSGYIAIMNGVPVAWASRRQKIVTLSTAEAELVAASQAAQETEWLRQMLTTLYGVPEETIEPIELRVDNQAAIQLSTNQVFHQRTKHVDIKYKYIRAIVESGNIFVKYCPTEDQLADLLTKGLPKPRFNKLKERLNMQPRSQWEC